MAGVGYRFRPEDEFLINVLEWKTKKWEKFDVSVTTAVPGDLSELDMYGPGKEPWNLFSGAHEIWELSDSGDAKMKVREKYVVTKLNRVGKKNCSRVAGAGCWVDKSAKRSVNIGGQKVGHWRTLIYEYSGGDGAAEGKSYYFMNELHLSKPSDYVVCRVMKNVTKACQLKFSTKRRRQDGDQDLPATKRSRPESSSSCADAVHQLDDPLEQIDFSEVQDTIPAYHPGFFSCNISEEQGASFCSGDFSDSHMFGMGQNQEEQDYSWDYPELPRNYCDPSCSSTMPDQGSFDEWSLENIMELLNTEENCLESY